MHERSTSHVGRDRHPGHSYIFVRVRHISMDRQMLKDLDPLVSNMKGIFKDDVLDLTGVRDVEGRTFLILL